MFDIQVWENLHQPWLEYFRWGRQTRAAIGGASQAGHSLRREFIRQTSTRAMSALQVLRGRHVVMLEYKYLKVEWRPEPTKDGVAKTKNKKILIIIRVALYTVVVSY